jgi:hypothetical protein
MKARSRDGFCVTQQTVHTLQLRETFNGKKKVLEYRKQSRQCLGGGTIFILCLNASYTGPRHGKNHYFYYPE